MGFEDEPSEGGRQLEWLRPVGKVEQASESEVALVEQAIELYAQEVGLEPAEIVAEIAELSGTEEITLQEVITWAYANVPEGEDPEEFLKGHGIITSESKTLTEESYDRGVIPRDALGIEGNNEDGA
ncbi:hypothetical protein HY375_01650 [Candidatus Berkelbacteria bacterium]|nr:hypothetical protein [Candidatus Berkelbacteria bacterium]